MDIQTPETNPVLKRIGTALNKEYFMLLRDMNLIESLKAYDYTYFEMAYPNVTRGKYRALKNIIEGNHPTLNILFVKYSYHDYKNNSEGYIGMFNNKIYEKLNTDLPAVAWKCKDQDFKKYMIIYIFKGREFDSCEFVTYLEDEQNDVSNICIARKNVIFDKNFA